jgi:hypothetical protein
MIVNLSRTLQMLPVELVTVALFGQGKASY